MFAPGDPLCLSRFTFSKRDWIYSQPSKMPPNSHMNVIETVKTDVIYMMSYKTKVVILTNTSILTYSPDWRINLRCKWLFYQIFVQMDVYDEKR